MTPFFPVPPAVIVRDMLLRRMSVEKPRPKGLMRTLSVSLPCAAPPCDDDGAYPLVTELIHAVMKTEPGTIGVTDVDITFRGAAVLADFYLLVTLQ